MLKAWSSEYARKLPRFELLLGLPHFVMGDAREVVKCL